MALSCCWYRAAEFGLLTFFLFSLKPTDAFTSSEYGLDTEYSGSDFFDGWNFFTDTDPTAGFVVYQSQIAAQQAELISAPSDAQPVYIGVDHVNIIPASATGRSSVRVSSKKSWTHGLFIGDFNHIPAGACGTWPAFWTLGPDWPYTGEIDILEGVNDIETNAISLHTNETCTIMGNTNFQTGVQGSTDCAIYPGQYVGCGVIDNNIDSYSNFNNIGGGVYAMQWTSDYIRVWFFARSAIPQDITAGTPDPTGWGEPVANMDSPTCPIDTHFQQHSIVLDTTFCGTYAGSVWPSSTCQTNTGYASCNAYVAANPQAFINTYWSINSIRVYKLIDPLSTSTSISSTMTTFTNTSTSSMPTTSSTFVETIPMSVTYEAPNTTYTTISDGNATTITSVAEVSPTHPVFNTTSVDPNSIGPGMGTYTNASFSGLSTAPSTYTSTVSMVTTSNSAQVEPPSYAGFDYVGCKGSTYGTQGFVLAANLTDMNVERCLYDCGGAPIAAIFGQYCFCGDVVLEETVTFTDYPDSFCNIACPGNTDQSCGGVILSGEDGHQDSRIDALSHKFKRQVAYPADSIILFTIYEKVGPSIEYPPNSTTTTTSTITVTNTSMVSDAPLASSSSTTSSSISMSSVSGSVSYNITATNTVTEYAISTTWHDHCATCPNFQTTRSTTITVLHCGCTAQANEVGLMTPVVLPTIPMMTTTKKCACGKGGAASTTVVTIPCTSGISALKSSLAAQHGMAPGVFVAKNVATETSETMFTPAVSSASDTATQTMTSHSMEQPAAETTVMVVPVEHKILGPVIPIVVSGEPISLRNASDTSGYEIPALSQPRSTAITTASTSPIQSATLNMTMARSAGANKRILGQEGCFGCLLFLINVVVIGGMLVM